MNTEAWSVADLCARGARVLLDPDQPAPFVVHGRAAEWMAINAERVLTQLEVQLLASPAVTVAIVEDAPAGSAPLLDFFDVVGTVAEAGLWLDSFSVAPQACTVIARLLRDDHRSLVAEAAAYSALQSGSEFRAWLSSRPSRRAADNGDRVRAQIVDGLMQIRLTRPVRLNAFDARMREELCDALDAALDMRGVPVMLLGDGPSFCAGGDLDEFGSFVDPVHALLVRTGRSVAARLKRLAPRLVAGVQGWCVGAGIEMAAFAAHLVAADTATFCLPEIGMGLLPGAGGTVSLPSRIGRKRTLDLALSRRRLDAATALEWGLVDEVVPERRLEKTVRARGRERGEESWLVSRHGQAGCI